MEHLCGTVNPLIGSVHAVLPERVRGVVVALYDVSLDLFAASLLGPEATLPFLERLWREVLPAAARSCARAAAGGRVVEQRDLPNRLPTWDTSERVAGPYGEIGARL